MKTSEPEDRYPNLVGRWTTADFLVLDLEGTGSGQEQRIVEIAAFVIRNGQVQDESFYRLLNPGIKISPIASSIHGIQDHDVAGMPCISAIEAEFEAFAGDKILVAHNAAVERKLLSYNLPSLHFLHILDTLRLSRTLYPECRKHSLDDLIARFNLNDMIAKEADFQRHRAKYDAFTTAHALVAMVTDRLGCGVTIGEILKIASLPPAKNETQGLYSSSQPELF